jgi:hypothetical protein
MLEHARGEFDHINLHDPRELLKAVAEYLRDSLPAPVEVFEHGTFGGIENGGLTIENGHVILVRFAEDESHLVKSGASADEKDLSVNFGGPAVHLSANPNYNPRAGYGVKGVFRIPVADFLNLAKENHMQIGALDQQEIVMDGKTASRYLDKIENLEVPNESVEKSSDLPEEIKINW